jgi:hypothetical protein
MSGFDSVEPHRAAEDFAKGFIVNVTGLLLVCCRCVAGGKEQRNPCKMGLVAVLPIFRSSIYNIAFPASLGGEGVVRLWPKIEI